MQHESKSGHELFISDFASGELAGQEKDRIDIGHVSYSRWPNRSVRGILRPFGWTSFLLKPITDLPSFWSSCLKLELVMDTIYFSLLNISMLLAFRLYNAQAYICFSLA